MNAALLDEKSANVFAKLGLDQNSLLRARPEDAFNKVIDGIRKVSGLANKQNILTKLFGRQGVSLMTVVADPNSFSDAKQMVGSMADQMDSVAPQIDKIEDILGPGGVAVKFRQIFFGILVHFKDKLTGIADWFKALDFVDVGKNLAKWLEWGWNSFQTIVSNPSGLWTALSEGFRGVALKAAAYFIGAMEQLPVAMVSFVSAVLPAIATTLFSALKAAGGALALGMIEGMETIKEILPEGMRNALDKIINAGTTFQDYTGMGWIMKQLTGTYANDNYNDLKKDPEKIKTQFADNINTELKNSLAGIADTMKSSSKILTTASSKFKANADLLADAELAFQNAYNQFDLGPTPNSPMSGLKVTPGSTSTQTPSIWDKAGKGDGSGLRVSLDNNKMEMSGPHVVRMVTSLENIEDKLTIE
jgi:hypothetical protein